MGFNALLAFAGAFLCSGLGAFVLFRDPRSFVHRTFAVGMVTLALREVFAGMGSQALSVSSLLYWKHLELIAAACMPGSWLLFSLSFARANSTAFVARWKWPALASFVFPLMLVTIFQNSLFTIGSFSLDLSSLKLIPLGWSGYGYYIFFLLMSVVILMNLEETLRASTGSKRWQIKFMILGLGSLFAIQIYTLSQTLLFSAIDQDLQPINSSALVIADMLIILSLTRYHLLTMNIYLSQAFLHNSITILVVGFYLLAVGVLAKVIEHFGRSSILPLGTFFVFLALVGLAITLLSDQLRQKARWFISRHLRRPQYDYRQVWTTFTQRTSSLLDIQELCAAVSAMVSETFGTPDVTLWLLDDSSDRISLGGSTTFSSNQIHYPISMEGLREFTHYLCNQEKPVDFDNPLDTRTRELKQAHLGYFREARVRYGVPLVAGQQLLGIMTLSDRLTKEPFLEEDFNLLKTIADQAAGSLLNLKLSQHLVQAKEMEAFHTVSAFFLHDLKNTTSMLSLMLQNLPIHYDNPLFRDDALRVIAQSVSKLNTMCSRLSLFKKLELHTTEVDLNELATTTLISLKDCITASLVQHLRPLPKLILDPNQLEKVLTNLLLNANEAGGEHSEIRVTTDQQDAWAVLTVSDTGCGMSKEFMERSLFQPFQTTKKQGLGIGLFHSKMIVEAHQGRIEVESEEGKGSTFRVLLPVRRERRG